MIINESTQQPNVAQDKNQEFHELTTTQRGDIGEQFAWDFLESIGYQVWPNRGTQSQIFDAFANSGTTVRNLVEVKVKYPTKFGTMSIHQNDLVKYLDQEKIESRQMIILYLDYINGDINVITPKSIVKNTVRITKEKEEHKNLVYFKGWNKRGEIPQEICNQIKSIQ